MDITPIETFYLLGAAYLFGIMTVVLPSIHRRRGNQGK